jgi:hypothetical protein
LAWTRPTMTLAKRLNAHFMSCGDGEEQSDPRGMCLLHGA